MILNLNLKNGRNSRRVKIGDSPVAPVDKDLFGKDYIKETAGASGDYIKGNLSTGRDYLWDKITFWDEKINPPTTAISKATEELILAQENKM